MASTAILGLKAQSTNISPRSTQQWPVMVPYKSWIWGWVLMKCKLMRFSFCLKVCGGIIDDSKQLSCLLLLNEETKVENNLSKIFSNLHVHWLHFQCSLYLWNDFSSSLSPPPPPEVSEYFFEDRIRIRIIFVIFFLPNTNIIRQKISTEYEYEYYSSKIFHRIRIWILFGLKISRNTNTNSWLFEYIQIYLNIFEYIRIYSNTFK